MGNGKSIRVLYLFIIVIIIVTISYISANRLERRSAVAGILGAGGIIGVGIGIGNGLFDSAVFCGLPLRFSFAVGDSSMAYISNYALISGGMGISGYWV